MMFSNNQQKKENNGRLMTTTMMMMMVTSLNKRKIRSILLLRIQKNKCNNIKASHPFGSQLQFDGKEVLNREKYLQ